MAGMGRRFVVSVLVGDRVGILRDITSAVTDLGANIDGISQTVVEGYFTVILTASFENAVTSEAVETAIAARFRDSDVSIIVKPRDPAQTRRVAVEGDRYVVTISGTDRTAILKTITVFLAEKGINIEDWSVLFKGPLVTHVGEVTVPDTLDIKQMQEEFRQALAPLALTLSIQHENIFRATNKVGAIQSIIRERTDVTRR